MHTVGIAGVGNSKEDRGRFCVPENPGRIDPPRAGAIKRQIRGWRSAARPALKPALHRGRLYSHQKAAWCALQGRRGVFVIRKMRVD